MNLPARMAWRYLFARKSTNAINIITFIAAFGVAIGASALVLVLSVFNGFEDLYLRMFNNLNPDVSITAVKGKTFVADEVLKRKITEVPGVEVISETLEETARFEHLDRQAFGPLKGIDHYFPRINGIDTMVEEGEYDLDFPEGNLYGAIVGKQLASDLFIDPLNRLSALSIAVPRPRPRGATILGSGRLPYRQREVMPTGVILGQESLQNQAVLVRLDLAREMLGVGDSVVSALELKLAPGFATSRTYREIRAAVGEGFSVKNRYQQENSILKLMQLEKWYGFAVACLMMILISFNLVGALWMIVLEKREDIIILQSMGMTRPIIQGVFLRVGLLICGLGLLAGFVLAGLLYLLQINYGLVSLPGQLAEAYPISFRIIDFLTVTATVFAIGLIASVLPARLAGRMPAVVTDE